MLSVREPTESIYVAEFSAPISDADVQRFIAERDAFIATKRPHVLVLVVDAERMPASLRSYLPWGRKAARRANGIAQGYAVVVRSRAVRTVLRMLFAVIMGRKRNVHFCESVNDALQWAGEQMALHTMAAE